MARGLAALAGPLGHVFNCRLSPGWAVVLEMISKFACKPPLYPCNIFNPCWACARGRRTRFLPKCLCARNQRNHSLIQNWFKTGSKLVHHFPPKISNMSKICFDSCFRLFVVPQNCSQNADVTSFQKPEKNGFEPVSACRPSVPVVACLIACSITCFSTSCVLCAMSAYDLFGYFGIVNCF